MTTQPEAYVLGVEISTVLFIYHNNRLLQLLRCRFAERVLRLQTLFPHLLDEKSKFKKRIGYGILIGIIKSVLEINQEMLYELSKECIS